MTVTVHHGDSRDVIRSLADASIDSCVSDPPYALVSIGKRFGADNAAPAKPGKSGAYARASAGFMGQKWDTGEVAFDPAFWAEVLRVLKPGGHVLAFGGTRTYHRLAVAIEDAGFEIRDAIQWLYGSGFPKSHNVGKGIDKAAGAERELTRPGAVQRNGYGEDWDTGSSESRPRYDIPATDAARQWEGWGTALKPACEIICVARKPLVGTVAANILAHGTGALNIDGCRVATSAEDQAYIAERIGGFNNTRSIGGDGILGGGQTMDRGAAYDASKGRWPANVVHDGSDEVVSGFPQTNPGHFPTTRGRGGIGSNGHSGQDDLPESVTANGSASRFFYTAKADAADRLGSKHPTVKPVDLMRWLVRLVTPPGGTVLDPFAGSGTTGMACLAEGFNAVLIEREAAYVADIKRRIAHVSGQDAPLFAGTPSDTPPGSQAAEFTASSRTNHRPDRNEDVTADRPQDAA